MIDSTPLSLPCDPLDLTALLRRIGQQARSDIAELERLTALMQTADYPNRLRYEGIRLDLLQLIIEEVRLNDLVLRTAAIITGD